MGERDWDLEERKLLEATLRVVEITSNHVVQNPEGVEDLTTNSQENSSNILQNFAQSDKPCTITSEQMVPKEEECTTVLSNDYPEPPPLTPIDPIILPVEGIGKIYTITFYFPDGEVKITRFPENTTYNDIMMYLRNGKYRHEDWTSVYCDVSCREPKMNLGKMKMRQGLSQTKLPDKFSVDVKIKNLFD